MSTSKPNTIRRSTRRGDARGEKGSKNEHFPPRTVRLVDGRRITFAPASSAGDRIRKIADAQRGRATRQQLLASGIKPSAITRRLQNGQLMNVHRGVYALPQTNDVPLAAETAALLACGEDAVLSHHSAVTLWGLRVGAARPIHVTVDGHRGCPAPEGVKVHRSTTLTPDDVRMHNGLPVTSPARTLFDAAATLPDRDVERMLDEGLFALRILTRKDIQEVLSRGGAHPGRARLAKVSGDRRPTQTDSPPEERVLHLIRAAGLPEPRTQFPVLDYRLDFFWPELKLAVEVDAYGTHGSRTRFEADRRRDARLLTEKGIVVVRLTQAAVEERPFEVTGLVARAIGQREARLSS